MQKAFKEYQGNLGAAQTKVLLHKYQPVRLLSCTFPGLLLGAPAFHEHPDQYPLCPRTLPPPHRYYDSEAEVFEGLYGLGVCL